MPVKNTPTTMLFELRHPAAPAPSFLFGTMHVRDERAFAHFEKAKTALEKCARFAAEFNLRDADHAVFTASTRLPVGQMLDALLTKPAFKKLEKRLMSDHKLPSAQFRHLHPVVVSSMLAEPFLGSQSTVPLDEALLEFAEKKGLQISGVETFQEQVAVFGKLPIEDAAQNLTWMVKNHGRMKKQVLRMLETYAAGDVRKLYKVARKNARGLREPLIFERNDRMVDRIAAFSLEMPTFSAIGAGHLGGKMGVLAGLKRAGFVVLGVN